MSSGLRQLGRHNGGNTLKSQDYREGLRVLPLNPLECGQAHRDNASHMDRLKKVKIQVNG